MSSAADCADAAYQAVRELNHRTYPGQCELTTPADAYAVVAGLEMVIYALPQALRQLADWLEREAAAGRVRVVAGPYSDDNQLAMRVVRDHLTRVVTALRSADESMSAVHNVLADFAANEGISL